LGLLVYFFAFGFTPTSTSWRVAGRARLVTHPIITMPHVTTLLRYCNPTIDVARSTRFPLPPPCLSFSAYTAGRPRLRGDGCYTLHSFRQEAAAPVTCACIRQSTHHTHLSSSDNNAKTPKQGGLPACRRYHPSIPRPGVFRNQWKTA